MSTLRTVEEHDPKRGDDTHFVLHRGPTNKIDLRREIGTLTDNQLRNRQNNIVNSLTPTCVRFMVALRRLGQVARHDGRRPVDGRRTKVAARCGG